MGKVVKNVKLQSAKYKVHQNGSNETSIFLSHQDIIDLNINGNGNIIFTVYKDDFINGLGMLMVLSELPLYKKDVYNFTYEDYRKYLNSIENFFHENSTEEYKVNFFINTSQSDRNYFNELEYNGLNIRNFLVENHSQLFFENSQNKYSLRFKTYLDEITEVDTLIVNEDSHSSKEIIQNKIPSSPSPTEYTSPEQIIFYGVPGSGKSHEIKHKLETEYKIPEEKQDVFVERTVFHPEYTNADFIGQIMPKLVQGKTDFVFKPGPFTSILKKALCDSQNRYVLIIEEINRGNAAAIFGELFQLLDRIDDESKTTSHDGSLNIYGKGWSEYFVMNSEINNYIRDTDDTFDGKALDINGIHFSANTGIRLPPNLSILATMNTSDQNVFTLDNAFQRRWDMKLIENAFGDTDEEINQRNAFVDSAKQITWERFQKAINIKIGKMSEDAGLSSMEDKRLGCWFVKAVKTAEKDKDGKDIFVIHKELFAEKVLKYLWDDAFKFCREKVFNNYTNLESLTRDFKGEKEFSVFKDLFTDVEL